VVWLNHDCIPEKGTIMALVEEAAKAGTGAVTAWCKTNGYEGIMVNPGFRNFKEIPPSELQEAPVVVVDGVNGNCVAINAEAIKTIGLPDGLRHPHYGDGPYTWRLHRAGYINKVLTKQHALLVREFERCIDERSHSSVWPASLKNKLHYYFLSPRSKYHWKSRFYDLLVFRGKIIGTFLYPFVQAKLIVWVSIGHFQGKTKRQEDIIRIVTSKYSEKLPVSGLYEALVKLSQRKP
jgi:GT2 family glycosyltransferase